MQSNFYVYILFRPWDGTPCYIGKGKGKRWLVHERHRHGCTNPRLLSIIKRADGSLPKEKVAENLTEREAFEIERQWIAKIGRGSKGPLVNLTDGGDGTSGIVVSQARRDATSRRHKGKTLSAGHLAALAKYAADRVWSPESKEKIRLSKIGKKRSPETITKMSAATKLHMADQKRKAAVAAANSARVWTTEMRTAHGFRMAEVAAQKKYAEVRL